MGKVAVVTGGSAGIGLATAQRLAETGWAVAILARDPTRLGQAAALLRRSGTQVLAIPVDVAEAVAVDAAADRIAQELGPPDAWVNNAMATVIAPAEGITAAEYAQVTAATYLGQVHGTLAALRHMRPRGRGAIVQVSSALAIRAAPLQAAYCGAKAAVGGFTDALRAELHADRLPVTLSVIYLPAVNTPQFGWTRTRTGREQVPPDPVFDPRACSDAIVGAITNSQREVWVGRTSVLAALGQSVAPGLMDRQASGMRAKQLGATMPDREGNLFAPVPGPAAIDGAATARVGNAPPEILTSRDVDLARLGAIGAAGAIGGAGAAAGLGLARLLRRLPFA